MNRSATGLDRRPAVIAVMRSSYCPDFSSFVREIRPAKKTSLVPLWPTKVKVPAGMVLQLLRRTPLWVLARQL